MKNSKKIEAIEELLHILYERMQAAEKRLDKLEE